METEEETSLKNHLKWARIKNKSDGVSAPKEIMIAHKGLEFTIPIWCESPTRVAVEKEEERGLL